MKKFFLILVLFIAPIFAEVVNDKETEAEGPGRCAFCDEHTARIDERDVETNPNALTLLYLAQSANDEEAKPASDKQKSDSSQGVK